MNPPREATHDDDGFARDVRVGGTYTCTAGNCANVATVLDEDFVCDEHWLWCHTCGTGYFMGIDFIYCPRCHAEHFKEIGK